jgi:hypothetical protein
VGGAGGTSGPTGGAGGVGGALNFDGIAGSGPGGGAGGSGDASPGSVTDPQGAGGQLSISWTSVRNTNNSRVFQQMVNADNTLGPLTEITAAAFPSRGRLSAPIPISFDAAIRNGIVSIAFTGAISTTGRDNITVGVGAIASPVAFTFQTFTCGNGGNNADSCPAVAPAAAGLYCCYISAPTGGPVAFEYVLDSGSGFGAPVTIGTLTTGNVHAESRLQAAVLVAAPEITWGTPTYANKAYVPPT